VFEPTSRYAPIEEAVLTVDGRVIRYKRRRFIPPPDGDAVVEHTVAPGERLDLIAARFLGDPTGFWRLCDAAGVLDPAALERPGVQIAVRLEAPR
jgi:hypothetical protein